MFVTFFDTESNSRTTTEYEWVQVTYNLLRGHVYDTYVDIAQMASDPPNVGLWLDDEGSYWSDFVVHEGAFR